MDGADETIADAVADQAAAERAVAEGAASQTAAQASTDIAAAAATSVATANAAAELARVNAAESSRQTAEKIQSFEEYQAWNATQLENLSTGLAASQNQVQSELAPMREQLNNLSAAFKALLTPQTPAEGTDPASATRNGNPDAPGKTEANAKKKFRHI